MHSAEHEVPRSGSELSLRMPPRLSGGQFVKVATEKAAILNETVSKRDSLANAISSKAATFINCRGTSKNAVFLQVNGSKLFFKKIRPRRFYFYRTNVRGGCQAEGAEPAC